MKITSDGDEVTIKMDILDVDKFCCTLDNAAMALDDVEDSDSSMVDFIYKLTRQLTITTQNL